MSIILVRLLGRFQAALKSLTVRWARRVRTRRFLAHRRSRLEALPAPGAVIAPLGLTLAPVKSSRR